MSDILMEWYPLSLVVFAALLAFLWLSRDPHEEERPLEFEER